MITGGIIFVLGLIFGSFLNAWEYRLEYKKSLGGRSFCPKCKKRIEWYDNLPVMSWIILRGKCRMCQKPISALYPAVELITGFIFLLLWLYSSSGMALQEWLIAISSFEFRVSNQFPMIELISLILLLSYFTLLILISLHDAKTKYVLTKHTYVAALIGLAYTALQHLEKAPTLTEINLCLLAVFVPAGILWLIAKVSKEKAMGFGDADIALAIGAILGWPKILPAYYFAFITGAVYGVFVLLRKKGGLKSEIPLGPFLIAGAFFSFALGQQIIDWYLHLVLGM